MAGILDSILAGHLDRSPIWGDFRLEPAPRVITLVRSLGSKKVRFMEFEVKTLPEDFVLAPDGSQIRLLPIMNGGSMVHCTLESGGTSLAVAHRTVAEIWYFIEGEGQVWLRQGKRQQEVDVQPGVSLTIPTGTHFQFRNTGAAPLRFIIITMPPWPGADEAYRVEDHWPVEE
jgi:mannose-6-phosphate isomerase-like protein (cupin superfamily)